MIIQCFVLLQNNHILISFYTWVTQVITLLLWQRGQQSTHKSNGLTLHESKIPQNKPPILKMKDTELELNLLLQTIARMLTVADVQRAKRELRGHVNGESLEQVRKGKDFVEILCAKGLVNNNKLMFLKKVLHSTNLFEPERLLDEYIARKRNPRLENNEDNNSK